MSAAVDPRRCPLCQGDNACGIAQGKDSCWCMTRVIAKDALERVPEAARERACVCEACGASFTEPRASDRKLALSETKPERA
jgi:hypothetical protein